MQLDCTFVLDDVNPAPGTAGGRPRRGAARAARTQRQVIAAATALFRDRGYRATTLTDVAEAAGVAPRTVYLRFGTKAELFRRVMDVAVAGDDAPVDVEHRDWVQVSLTAPTLEQRLAVRAAGVRALMERIGPLLPAATEGEYDDPAIAAAFAAARADTTRLNRLGWERAHADGLLHPDADLDWLADTTALLASADTYLLVTRIHGWTPEQYEQWYLRTFHHLATTPAPEPAPAPPTAPA